MKRWVKILLIVLAVLIVAAVIGVILYFTVFKKDIYRLTDTDHTEYTASDFKNSELQFFDNGTFHVKIIHNTQGVFVLGIGTYEKESSKQYKLTFVEVLGRQADTIINQTANYPTPYILTKSGNRWKFVDHNNQIYYFG